MIADLGRALAQREDRVSGQLFPLSLLPHHPSTRGTYHPPFSCFSLDILPLHPPTFADHYRPTRVVTSNPMAEEDSDVNLMVPTRSDSAMSLLSQVSISNHIISIVFELL